MIKVIELFAGIGSQREALKRANIEHEIVAISENDKYASRAYELLHGPTNNLGDIREIERLPKADLWTYSFPCTDISLAGKMKGFVKGSNTHSSLLWEVQRLLEVAKENYELPKFLLMENVKNIVSKKFMPLFQVWLDYLDSLGYKNFYKALNAKDYGVPQNRERCFMISIRDKNAHYEFPKPIRLTKKLADLLENEVDEKYFLSEKFITCFTDMKDRHGLIRCQSRILKNLELVLDQIVSVESIEDKILKVHEDIDAVVNEVEVLIHSSSETDGIKEKELELKYDKLIRKLKDLEHQKEEVTDKRNEINTFISTLKKKANIICEFDDELFNIMVDKAVIHRDKSIEFIFNSGYKVKVEARK